MYGGLTTVRVWRQSLSGEGRGLVGGKEDGQTDESKIKTAFRCLEDGVGEVKPAHK